MNYSTAVMLINPNIRAIKTIYKPDLVRADGKSALNESRVIFKTLDTTIQKGDLVVVQSATRHNYTTVMVEDVDVEVDFEAHTEIKWVVDKISFEKHKETLVEETKWIDSMKASEKRRKREEIKKNMLAMFDDEAIDKLPIAHMGDPLVAAIEHKE